MYNDLEEMIDLFMAREYSVVKEREFESDLLREQFVSDYPIHRIMELSLDDYLIAPKGKGNDDSFCRRLRYQLDPTAHMGNVFPSVFGMYLKNGNLIQLDSTLYNEYGNNVSMAFDSLKAQIVMLLHVADNDDYDAIARFKINSSFKYKLLITYFPEKFIPVCTKATLKGYCDAMGVSCSENQDIVYWNISLLNWKQTHYPFSDWTNFLFMRFCDWAWRNKIKVTARLISDICSIESEKIDENLDVLQLVGKDREAIVRVRMNQSVFRSRLLTKYKKCCLCRVAIPDLLIASHIKPWSVCNPEEKLDVDNGLLLCPNHDRLFDGGWITFDDDGKIMISKRLTTNEIMDMNMENTIKLTLSKKGKLYLKYHRENIYI